ncbi:pyridoxal phosphate-dependent decarboxylase family protein [Angustibacter luteus]|uniref:Aspartate aminotransferase family protein n=1 Tax=Angustibacter luteus TaxID=658456 RepID=A0ABW1JCJ7_9ACTN
MTPVGTRTAPAGAASDLATGPEHLLLGSDTAASYARAVVETVLRVSDRVAATPQAFTGISPAALAAEVDQVDLSRPLPDLAAALDELEPLYLRDAVWFHHPRYLAHLNCPVAVPALAAEAIIAAVNSSMDTWDQSAGATLIERRLVDWTADRVGLGPDADGVFTSGGTQSNLQALLLAREAAAGPDAGNRDLSRLRVLASRDAHFSVTTSAKLLGLAPEAVIAVDVDADRRMDAASLRRELAAVAGQGLVPMAVVATAGTTDFGVVDPLRAIADACRAAGVWLHVDAAYGCGLLVSPRRRHLLAGIERADSVTVDFHKSFFQPVSSSAVLVRDRAVLRHVRHHADYLNPERHVRRSIPNQVDKSLQTTRRFDALKLWLTLRVMGADGVGRLFDDVVDLAADVAGLVAADPRFELASVPELSTVVFRCTPEPGLPEDVSDALVLAVREGLSAHGEAVVASTTVDGRHHLKLTLLNPRTTLRDVAQVLDLAAVHAERSLAVIRDEEAVR